MVQVLISIKILTTNSCVLIRLDKARTRMAGYLKFNSSLSAEDDFWNHLEIMIKRELTGAIIGNRWWGKLKDSIRSFAADYSRRIKLDMVAEQRSIKDKLDRAVLAGVLESVLSAAGFGLHFRTWIRLLYASPGVMVEVNVVRSEPFTLTRSIRQGCPLSPMLYILVLVPFSRKLKANPALRGLTLPGFNEVARYTAYADDVSVLVTSSAEVEEVSKEIGRYEAVSGAKINHEKSVGLRVGS